MSEFLRELGYSPPHYWLFAGVSLILWLASAAGPYSPRGRGLARLNAPAVFAFLLLVPMFAFRWPGIFFFRPVNPDEAQFLAGAITMVARSDPWWPDATTSGPLVVLPLTLPAMVGLAINFSTGRIVGVLLTWGISILTYLILRHVHGDRLARLLVLPLAAFMVFLLFWDFVPYCSELCPVFLCVLCVWLGATAFQQDGTVQNRWRLAACGIVLGLLPFSKFQVLPVGAAIGVALMIWIVQQPGGDLPQRIRDMLWFGAGVAGGAGIIVASLWWSGGMEDVFRSYILHGLDYAQSRNIPWAESWYTLRYLTEISWGFTSFHAAMLGLLLLGLAGLRLADWRLMMLGWLWVCAAYYAAVAPGRLYPHYLIFLTAPLGLLVGLQFGFLVRSSDQHRRRQAILTVFLLLGFGPQLVDRAVDRHSLQKLITRNDPRADTVRLIAAAKQPGDTLAVWGWRPEFHVDTQLPQATREAHTAGQVHEGPQRDYFRARFLADLRASRPAFFIDAVGPDGFNFQDRAHQGHETFPALADFVRREYSLVGDPEPYRVYIRRDRIHAQ